MKLAGAIVVILGLLLPGISESDFCDSDEFFQAFNSDTSDSLELGKGKISECLARDKSQKEWKGQSEALGLAIVEFLFRENPGRDLERSRRFSRFVQIIRLIRTSYRREDRLNLYHEIASAAERHVGRLDVRSIGARNSRFANAIESVIPVPTHTDFELLRNSALNELLQEVSHEAKFAEQKATLRRHVAELDSRLSEMEGDMADTQDELEEVKAKVTASIGFTGETSSYAVALVAVLALTLAYVSFRREQKLKGEIRKVKSKGLRTETQQRALGCRIKEALKLIADLNGRGGDIDSERSQSARSLPRQASTERHPVRLELPATPPPVVSDQVATSKDLDRLLRSVDDRLGTRDRSIWAELQGLQECQQQSKESTIDLLVLERHALRGLRDQIWRRLKESRFLKIVEDKDPEWSAMVQQACTGLPAHLDGDLEVSAKAVADPLRNAQGLVAKLTATKRILESSPEAAHGTNQEEDEIGRTVFQMREYSFHLLWLLNTEEGQRRLDFSIEHWVRTGFREFADQFFREFWSRQLTGQAESLGEARDLVTEILSWGGLEIVELTPGATRFDSAVHIGSSRAFESKYRDGVIVGVVRVGFRDQATGNVIQKPEVIVNRV